MARRLIIAVWLALSIAALTAGVSAQKGVRVNGASTSSSATLSGLGTTATDANVIQNTTPATAGATVQLSPALKFCGTAWNSSGSASETDCGRHYILPATVAGATTFQWKWDASIASGAFSNIASLSSAGTFSTATHTATTSFNGPGTVATAGDVRLQNATSLQYADSAAANQLLASTGGTNNNLPIFGNVNYAARLRSVMATPSTLVNGDWWAESNTGAVTGASGIIKAQLNGATVTIGGGPMALLQAQPVDQTARSSSGAFVMMGLGAAAAPCSITPVVTGRVVFTITGDIVNNTTATTITIKMAENNGTAPANNAAATGNVITIGKVIDGLTSDLTQPFTLIGTKTGLTLGTAYWFDIQLQTSSTNTGQPTNVDCVAYEL